MPQCSIIGCRSKKSENISLHRLPTIIEERNVWLDLIGRENIDFSRQHVFICSLHFEDSSLNRTMNIIKLQDGVLPSKYLLPGKSNVSDRLTEGSKNESAYISDPLQNDQFGDIVSKHNITEHVSSTPYTQDAMRTQQPACRCCLAVDGKLVSIHTRDFAQLYQDAAGLPADCTDRFPQHVCVFCLRSLQKFAQFRARCHKALEVLYQSLVHGNELTKEYIGTLASSCKEFKPQYVQSTTLAISKDGTIVNVSDINMSPSDTPQVPVEHTIPEVPIEHTIMEVQKCDTDTESLYNNVELLEEYLEPLEEEAVDVFFEGRENEEINDLGTFANSCDKDYAESLGFYLTELSLEEQVKEIEEKKKRPGFVCNLCGKRFNNSIYLQRHKLKHEVKPKSFVCDLCSWVFNAKKVLKSHILTHKQIFDCKFCPFKTNMRQILQKHHEFHQGKQYPCKYCDKVIMRLNSYLTHMKYKHDAELPWCDLCGEPFVGDRGVIIHKKLIHNNSDQYSYTCACNRRFRSEAALDRHVLVKGCELPSCVHCGESFPVPQMLKRHLMERHIEDTLPDTFECKSCVFRFYNHDALTRHECGACAACAQCGDSFETTQQLLDHTALRHQKLTCHECSRQFSSKAFKFHFQRAHAGGAHGPGRARKLSGLLEDRIRKWRVVDGGTIKQVDSPPSELEPAVATLICEVCGKGFANPTLLSKHKWRVHRAGLYACASCNKAFKTRSALDNHTRVHTDERPYQCPECPKAFKNRGAYTRHYLVHSGQRNHVCSMCDKSFPTSTSVKLHIQTAHMKLPWPARKRRRAVALPSD